MIVHITRYHTQIATMAVTLQTVLKSHQTKKEKKKKIIHGFIHEEDQVRECIYLYIKRRMTKSYL